MALVLGIETSCDDTSVALVNDQFFVLDCLAASQDSVHAPFGGVVPEIASRSHTEALMPLIVKLLEKNNIHWPDITGIAVTNRPGLIGSLIVGLVTGKALGMAHNKPLIGVHHLEGHLVAPFLSDSTHQGANFLDKGFVALVVSGGHTQLYHVRGFADYVLLGETRDDAAGEAFDKFAKMLGLPYPGGVQVDRLAQRGQAQGGTFPRSLLGSESFDFSFSGLKSSAYRHLQNLKAPLTEAEQADLCASYQEAIVSVLSEKLKQALIKTGCAHFVVTGGVSANSGLRRACQSLAQQLGRELALPKPAYCTDNGAMIALAGLLRLQRGDRSGLDLAPVPRASL